MTRNAAEDPFLQAGMSVSTGHDDIDPGLPTMASSWLPVSPADSSTRADACTLWRKSQSATSATRAVAASRSSSPGTISTIVTSVAFLSSGSAADIALRDSAVSFQATSTRSSARLVRRGGTTKTGRPAFMTASPMSSN